MKNYINPRFVGYVFKRRKQCIFLFTSVTLFVSIVIVISALQTNHDVSDISIVGLRRRRFSVADSPINRTSATHTNVWRLSGFFPVQINYEHATVSAFVFVRVLDTYQSVTSHGNLQQDSILQVLSTVWSRNVEIPETINLIQGSFAREGEIEPTFLRRGGVYLLPIIHPRNLFDEQCNRWSIRSSNTVLFEVDNRGRIWSHSPHADFNRFDSSGTDVLVAAIHEMTEDENFEAATSSTFAQFVGRLNFAYIEATVLGFTLDTRRDDGSVGTFRRQMILQVENVLLPLPNDPSWPYVGQEITTFFHTSDAFEVGGRYLLDVGHPYICSLGSVHERSVDNRGVVRVNEDRMFERNPPMGHFLRVLDGLTVEQLQEIGEQSRAWHSAHWHR